jgi:hypothetical protein
VAYFKKEAALGGQLSKEKDLSASLVMTEAIMSKDPSIKISVGTESGPNSSVWKIIGKSGSNDLYLFVRGLMGQRKISLHNSGKRIYAFLRDEFADNACESSGFPNPTRRIVEWNQPYT